MTQVGLEIMGKARKSDYPIDSSRIENHGETTESGIPHSKWSDSQSWGKAQNWITPLKKLELAIMGKGLNTGNPHEKS